MDPFLLLLRVLHIGSGIFWVGAAFTFLLFVNPSAKALGTDAQGAFMDQITRVRRLPMVVLIAGVVTVLAGATLYWRASGGLNSAWISTPTGIGFSIGALAGIVSMALGPIFIVPISKRSKRSADDCKPSDVRQHPRKAPRSRRSTNVSRRLAGST
jgi:uncharacterized membrane protein